MATPPPGQPPAEQEEQQPPPPTLPLLLPPPPPPQENVQGANPAGISLPPPPPAVPPAVLDPNTAAPPSTFPFPLLALAGAGRPRPPPPLPDELRRERQALEFILRKMERHRALGQGTPEIPIRLGRCQVQTGEERFGRGTRLLLMQRDFDLLQQSSAFDDGLWLPNFTLPERDHLQRMNQIVPKMQYHRNNLTALSQKYNLYFVSYEGDIYVYRPRSAVQQTLAEQPDLILSPAEGPYAKIIGGHVDPRKPHQPNHLVIGFLGTAEVLAVAFDDGVVAAYYTKDIAERVADNTRPTPKEFLHENVGKTAWGLAIHAKSRLIAVSSNLHEVTVFALGLLRAPAGTAKTSSMPLPVDYADKSVKKRMRNWRIIILFGPRCSNIPNITFLDDKDGYAEKILAQDLDGPLWIADIWRSCTKPIQIPHSCRPFPQLGRNAVHAHQQLGWGALALPESSFMWVNTYEDFLGMPKEGILYDGEPYHKDSKCINLGPSLKLVKDHPTIPPLDHIGSGANTTPNLQDLQSASDDDDADGADMVLPDAGQWPAADVETMMAMFGNTTNSTFGAENDNESEDADEDADEDEDESADNPDDMQDGNTIYTAEMPEEEEDDDEDEDEDGDEDEDEEEEDDEDDEEDDEENGDGSEADSNAGSMLSTAEILLPAPAPAEKLIPGVLPLPVVSPAEGLVASPTAQESWIGMIFTPYNGKTYMAPTTFMDTLKFLQHYKSYNRSETPQEFEGINDLRSRYAIFRTYEKDLELQFLDNHNTGMYIPDVLEGSQALRNGVHRFTNRISMLAHVAELSLVVAASLNGRVALLTLTRLRADSPDGAEAKRSYALQRGCRVDWVLPTRKDEQAGHKLKQPLYGMAIGPVQENSESGSVLLRGGIARPSGSSPRFRLMLHYRDHSIYTYELSRNDTTGALEVF